MAEVAACVKVFVVSLMGAAVPAAATPPTPDPVSMVAPVVGEITVGAKSPACVILDAALVAMLVVNCLVIVAAVGFSVADVAPAVVVVVVVDDVVAV